MSENRLPPGWDEERVRKVLTHYEEQTEAEAVAEPTAEAAATPAEASEGEKPAAKASKKGKKSEG